MKAPAKGTVSRKVREERHPVIKGEEKALTNKCCPSLCSQAAKEGAKKSKAQAKGTGSGKRKETNDESEGEREKRLKLSK
jgi:hypothetical protein